MVSLMKAIESRMRHCRYGNQRPGAGHGHNPTESLVAMLEGTGFDSRLDIKRLHRVKQTYRHSAARIRRILCSARRG